jgi:hypothetical protein
VEREHWLEASEALREVTKKWVEPERCEHPTPLIARVYLWAAAHDRSVNWACAAINWERGCRPEKLPSQSTLSRRGRKASLFDFMTQLGKRLKGKASGKLIRRCRIDGKALPVAAHSKDRNAKWGRGAGQKARGYKLHAIWCDAPMPEQWRVTPLDVVEKKMAARMLPHLQGAGYLLGDGHYDHSGLHDRVAHVNFQMIAPRQHPNCGLGHHHQSEHRLRSIQTLEVPAAVNTFGKDLYAQRKQIERDFGNLSGYGGGLITLPPWIRRPWRVRTWVFAKLILNACRIRCLQRKKLARA